MIESWLVLIRDAARRSRHIWPDYAACEAALESTWGESGLARKANNLFGMKQHVHPLYGTLSLPTREFLGGEWKVVASLWVKYPTFDACFADRIYTLSRLASHYPHYAAALAATSGEEYVKEVSKSWSTDPHRDLKVLEIYSVHKDIFGGSNVQISSQPRTS